MMAQRIKALKRWDANPRGRPASFTLIGLLVIIPVITLLPLGAVTAGDFGEPTLTEQTLAGIRACMCKSPAPWPQAWQQEYVDTIREAIIPHQDGPQYAERLRILCDGFGPHWESLRKGQDRALFEVHRAQIRWYVENLMSAELLSPEEKQKLRGQYKDLLDHAAGALVTQFPFLDPNVVQRAKADHLAECYRGIETPLLPVFRQPLTEDQVSGLEERWTQLRYARIDLWRQLGGGVSTAAKKTQVPSGNAHPDYLLTQRSLNQLRGQIWSVISAPPEYYRDAVAKVAAAQKKRVQSQAEAHAQEMRLGVAVWQTEYLSFLLTALLETAESFQEKGE